jgi:hypothetical protein
VGYRDVSAVGNRHALVAAIIPPGCVTTHTIYCVRTPLALDRQYVLCALLNSHVLNRVVRLLMGGHLTTSLVEGLPAPAWREDRLAQSTADLARLVCCGDGRMQARARLQGRIGRLYDLTPEWLAYLLRHVPHLDPAEAAETVRAFDDPV